MAAPITFGKYLLLDRINVGGMAEVFKAKTFGIEGFERIIAIKRILPNMADDEEFINMFVDEARIAVQLSHANIVQIYELGKIENQYYIAMEYVSGKDLRQILDRYRKKEKTLPVPAAAYITSKLCEGLDYAHRKSDPTGRPLNVIHRDVSPQNILVSFEGAVKITDFGIAKAEDRASKTQAGVLKGKFGYMSPEQVRGLEIDHRSDIFAVGILLYEMVTGKRLFIGESDFSTLERVRKAEVIPPSEHNPDLPPEFEQLVMRTLARERDERYQWASEMLDDLQTFLIDNNTIYNAKRLSGLLTEDYQSDIDAEMQRMEEYMRLPPPTAPATSEPVGAPPEAEAGDSTMVFESDFADLENAPTQIGESVSEHQVSRIEQMQTGSLVVQSKSAPARRPSGSQVRFKPENLRRATGGSPSKSLPVAVLSVAAVAFVALVCVLSYILFFAEDATGTLMVTSKPVNEDVEIALNDDVVATSTPFFQEGIKAGSYRLEARAPGFQTKIYNVQIVDGADAIVAVKFDKREVSNDGVARVITDPPGASVYRNDEKIGITPFDITDLNTDQEVEVTVKLDDYNDVTLRESFTPGSLKVELRATLEERLRNGSITVKSRPSGAIVYLDNERLGITPYEASDLDPGKSYDFELVKNGYRRTALTHRFNGELTVTKSVVLEPVATEIKASGTKTTGVKTGGGKGGGSKTVRTGKGGKCGGGGGTLSAIVLGEANCSVKVGPKAPFNSPTFRTEVPVGRCTIVVNCPSGKSYTETRTLKTGDNGKLIVKQDMLK